MTLIYIYIYERVQVTHGVTLYGLFGLRKREGE